MLTLDDAEAPPPKLMIPKLMPPPPPPDTPEEVETVAPASDFVFEYASCTCWVIVKNEVLVLNLAVSEVDRRYRSYSYIRISSFGNRVKLWTIGPCLRPMRHNACSYRIRISILPALFASPPSLFRGTNPYRNSKNLKQCFQVSHGTGSGAEAFLFSTTTIGDDVRVLCR